MKTCNFLLFFPFLLLLPFISKAQDIQSQKNTINLFLDCQHCDRSFIRQKITFINYVRDKEDADVHLLITRQRTGSGGTEFTLKYLGRKYFTGRNDTLRYVSVASDTDDEQRRGLVRYIKIGLVPYVMETPTVKDLALNYTAEEQGDAQSSAAQDQWNYWVFELSGDTFFSGEESRSHLYLSFGANADRVTPDWKINIGYDYNFNRRTFTETDSLDNKTTDIYTTRGQWFHGNVLKSLTKHWSAGFFTDANSSSRNNITYQFSASPGVEYNIYPYEEYSEHEVSFSYMVSPQISKYDEITIFDKRRQFLLRQRLRSRIDFTEPWGEIEGRMEASTYMHDLSKNRLDMRLQFDFRIFRGLSLNVSGRYSVINDQLSIPKGDISDAEQLLNLREQATSYSYRGSIGIEYSFGSIYNNVVNPRF